MSNTQGTKRALEGEDAEVVGTQKRATSSQGIFQWHPPIAPSCVYGTYTVPGIIQAPYGSVLKLAMFDIDGTLIMPKSVNKFAQDENDWTWLSMEVPKKLKEAVRDGFKIVLFTNQASPPSTKEKPFSRTIDSPVVNNFMKKMSIMATYLQSVPFTVYAALERDKYRKPAPAMWNHFLSLQANEGYTIDLDASFFVGDAAGRTQPKDFGASDRKFASNLGVDFRTPEQHFENDPRPLVVKTKTDEFNPKAFEKIYGTLHTPTNKPLFPPRPTVFHTPPIECIIMTGRPCAGKTSFYKNHWAKYYARVDADTTDPAALALAVQAASRSLTRGKSVFIDASHPSINSRKPFLALKESHPDVKFRSFNFTASPAFVQHQSVYSSIVEGTPLVSPAKLEFFKRDYEIPTVTEGFDQVVNILFRFVGKPENMKVWEMWLDVYK